MKGSIFIVIPKSGPLQPRTYQTCDSGFVGRHMRHNTCNALATGVYSIQCTRNNARQSSVGRAEGYCRGMAT